MEKLMLVKSRIDALYDGVPQSFSYSELVYFAVNFTSFEEKLPRDIYYKAVDRFREYVNLPKYKEKRMYNVNSFVEAMMEIQDDFINVTGFLILPSGDIATSDTVDEDN